MTKRMINDFEKFRVMAMSDSLFLHTGYATESKNLMSRLAKKKEFKVRFLGFQYHGDRIYADFDNDTVFSRDTEGCIELVGARQHKFGADVLPMYLEEFKPDLFWVTADLFMLPHLIDYDFGPTKFVMYFPSDGDHLVETDKPIGKKLLQKADVPVAYSEYARQDAIKAGIENCEMIPLGLDTKYYYPMDKMGCKKWVGDLIGTDLTNKFVIGSVSRFQGRKAVPELLKVFRDFAKDKDDVFLILKMDPNDPAGGPGVNLVNLMKRYNIQSKCSFLTRGVHSGFSNEEMGRIYNSFDVHSTCSSGEGFGLPITESMACGVPNVHPDYTTVPELLGDNERGFKVPLATKITGTYQVERGFVNKEIFTEHLNTLYNDPSLMKEMGQKAHKFSHENFDYETVIFPKWLNLFKRILE